MRKYLYYLGILIALLLTLNSCEKEMMDYEGEDALYFDVRSSIGAHEFFTPCLLVMSWRVTLIRMSCYGFRIS